MTAKEWLSRGQKLDFRINLLKELKQSAQAKKAGSNTAGLIAELDKEIGELENIKAEITDAINQVSDKTLRSLLTDYYLNDLTFEEVADRIGYTRRHVTRLHNRALSLIQPIADRLTQESAAAV